MNTITDTTLNGDIIPINTWQEALYAAIRNAKQHLPMGRVFEIRYDIVHPENSDSFSNVRRIVNWYSNDEMQDKPLESVNKPRFMQDTKTYYLGRWRVTA